MEEHPLELRGLARGDERNAFELRALRAARHQRGVLVREADQTRSDLLVGAARDLRVAGRDLDRVGARLLSGARHDEQRREAVPQIRGAEDDEQQRRHGHAAECHRVPLQRPAIHVVAAHRVTALIDCLLDELLDQVRRVILRDRRSRRRLDGAQNRGFELRIVFLEVHRDLRIADLPAQRTHEEQPHERGEHGDGDDAERDDRAGRETQRFEARGGQEQRQQRADHDEHDAANGQLLPPAIADGADDFEEFSSAIH